jgi:UDP-N-acetylmuramoyl-tripeptide--D-alanyl-D-alanine ligase
LKSNQVVIFSFFILLFDILTPLITSVVVLLFQPIAVLMRNRIINKARQKREKFPNLLVIGITGSYGKTSTKEFLYSILADKFSKERVLKTSEHQNSEVGISQCVLNNLNENHKFFVVEMGAYNRGGIKLLCNIVKPKIGILTGINEQHMATFGSQENIIKAKYELIESLPKDGIAFFNGRNKYCAELYDKTNGIKKFLYGQEAKFFGEENILGAMAAARELGMQESDIQNAANKIKDKFPGIKIKKTITGLNIIDATYSANPDGVMANLEYLKNNFIGKKIIVMPCLIELGKASREAHKRIGKKIAEVCDLAIITTSDRFGEIKEGAALANVLTSQKTEIIFMENPKKIFEKIMNVVSPPTGGADVVLLESRVPAFLIKKLTI